MSDNSPDRSRLREVLNAYGRLTGTGRALTVSQSRQRDELLRELQEFTGTKRQVVKKARQLLEGTVPGDRRSQKARHRGANQVGPRPPKSRDFDATSVERVVSTPTETDRRRH